MRCYPLNGNKFRQAERWTSEIADLVDASAKLISPQNDLRISPNMAACNEYSCDRPNLGPHKDREPECRGAGYTLITALSDRTFVLSNGANPKHVDYIEWPISMTRGDVAFIPHNLNYGPDSLYHSKRDGPSEIHFSVVSKQFCVTPSSF